MAFIAGKSKTAVVPEGGRYQGRYYDTDMRLWFDLGDPRDTRQEAQEVVRKFHAEPVAVITTRYRTRPNSNVGRYEARGFGIQRSIIGQEFADPHRMAAENLIQTINARPGTTPLKLGDETFSTQDGQRRQFTVFVR